MVAKQRAVEGRPLRMRALVGGTLVVTAGLAWAYTAWQARTATMPGDGMAADMEPMGLTMGMSFAAFLPMWTIMMAAMMFPSAEPVFSMVASIYRRRSGRAVPLATVVFATGYLVAWALVGVIAYLGSALVDEIGARSAEARTAGPYVGAGVFLLAAGYQFTRLKLACLTHCRTPFHFIMARWREGRAGSLRMGLDHGWYCVGCCWGLMAVLMVVGVMNLAWMAVLAVAIFVERVGPFARAARYGTALGLGIAGVLMAIDPGLVPGF